jgi:hypothetical protein
MYQRLHPRFVQLTDDQIQQALYESIIDVDSFLNLANELFNIAPDKFHKNYQLLIQGELLDISNGLKGLYNKYFGQVPRYNLMHYTYSSYSDGLSIALADAIERIRKGRELVSELSGQPEYSDISSFFHDSTIRGLQIVNLITLLYDQTFSYIPFS